MINVLVFAVYLHSNSTSKSWKSSFEMKTNCSTLKVITMDLKVLKDAEFLMKSEMAVVAGGAMSGCSSCCDKENGGTNQQQQQEFEKGDKNHN